MDARNAVASLKPKPKTKSKKVAAVDPTQSFDDFTTASGNYVAVQYRGNVVIPLVVSHADMKAIEEAMQS
jgi:hypothetical protein